MTEEEIDRYEDMELAFSDYAKFEGKKAKRQFERQAFMCDLCYTPDYDYPKLDFLDDDERLKDKKRSLYEAVLELKAAKDASSDPEEVEFIAAHHEMRLKRIMLVEAAKDLNENDDELCRKTFMDLNELLYGKYKVDYFLGLIDSEKRAIEAFEANDELEKSIKRFLFDELMTVDANGRQEKVLLSTEELRKLHDFVTSRYENILKRIPDTPPEKYYDVSECAAIINETLEAGGLVKMGWKCIESPSKAVPTTSVTAKTIFLPSNTCRNSCELKRLVIHEQEVHARRSQNAENIGKDILKTGTAKSVDAEEGLAVILECAIIGNFDNSSFARARYRYLTAGLALGADGRPRDAREVYEILWRLIAVSHSKEEKLDESIVKKSKCEAYAHIENAYRGTQFWMKGVIYQKLKIYYEGLVDNAHFMHENINDLSTAFDEIMSCKFDHTDEKERKFIRKILGRKS